MDEDRDLVAESAEVVEYALDKAERLLKKKFANSFTARDAVQLTSIIMDHVFMLEQEQKNAGEAQADGGGGWDT